MDAVKTTENDFNELVRLFQTAMDLDTTRGYKVWAEIDRDRLKEDIQQGLQYKILRQGEIACIFSVVFSDPLIWTQREHGDAIYLHRIVTNPVFKGQKLFATVLACAIELAAGRGLKFIRMDTWADNQRIIDYYLSFGFSLVGNYKTGNEEELPLQNRNIAVALLELELNASYNALTIPANSFASSDAPPTSPPSTSG